MPCGGIFPDTGVAGDVCWGCGQITWNGKLCDVSCIEWDGAPLHSACVEDWLQTEEGRIVLSHGHVVIIHDGFGNEKLLYEEIP